VQVIARSAAEYFYDLPPELIGKLWRGKWRGQRQWWFLLRFQGEDSDINIETDHAEFARWQWVAPVELPNLIVPFKRRTYEGLVAEFSELI
jgi:putative (di)nucleoside polyphosphate hydrolase